MLEPVDYKYKSNKSARHSFKHNYITNPETTPADAIISAANRMTETLHTHTPINMYKENLEALQRLETIFARAARTNRDVQIKSTPIRTPPGVQRTTPDQDTNKARTEALQELATQPRVQQTIFTDISKPSATPANETPATNTRSRRNSRSGLRVQKKKECQAHFF